MRVQSHDPNEDDAEIRHLRAEVALSRIELARLRKSTIAPVVDGHRGSLANSLLRVLSRWRLTAPVFNRLQQAGRMRALQQSGLFDADWYLDQYPDVEASEMDPARHYILFGWKERRAPGPGVEAEDIDTVIGETPGPAQRPARRAVPHLSLNSPDGIDEISRDRLPHYGPDLHRLVQTARLQSGADNPAKEHDKVIEAFDFLFYLTRYRDVVRNGAHDVVRHYLTTGAKEGRDPSASFSTRGYLAHNPHIKERRQSAFQHWLSSGRAEGLVADPISRFEELSEIIDVSPANAQEILIAKRQDLRDRFSHGVLGEMVAKAARLDPSIAHTWPEITKPKLPPYHSDGQVSRLVALYQLQAQAKFCRARVVIVVNKPRWGGGRRIEGHIAHAIAEAGSADDVLIVNSDASGPIPADRFPSGTRQLDFAETCAHLSDVAQQRILVEFLRSLQPTAVFNVNSRLFWNALSSYGPALADSTRVFACMFCNDQNELGFWTGYPVRMFYRHFDVLTGICTDSKDLAASLIEQYSVPPSSQAKITTLKAPVDSTIPVRPMPDKTPDRRPKVFWAGRLDRQKRVDIVFQIAAAMPDVDFLVWGEAVTNAPIDPSGLPPNLVLKGVYGAFGDLPLDQADLWLYTSAWDGVPSILLEVAMTGIPLVGTMAGGTAEVLLPRLSWPIDELNNIPKYVSAIEEILADPQAARQRAVGLRDAMIAERTSENYRQVIEGLISTDPVGTGRLAE